MPRDNVHTSSSEHDHRFNLVMTAASVANALKVIYSCKDVVQKLESDGWSCCPACEESLRKIQHCRCLKKANTVPVMEQLTGTPQNCHSEGSSTDTDTVNSTNLDAKSTYFSDTSEPIVAIENIKKEPDDPEGTETSAEKTDLYQASVKVKDEETDACVDEDSPGEVTKEIGHDLENSEPVPTRLIPNVHAGRSSAGQQSALHSASGLSVNTNQIHFNLPAKLSVVPQTAKQQYLLQPTLGNMLNVNQQGFNPTSVVQPANVHTVLPHNSATNIAGNSLLTVRPQTISSNLITTPAQNLVMGMSSNMSNINSVGAQAGTSVNAASQKVFINVNAQTGGNIIATPRNFFGASSNNTGSIGNILSGNVISGVRASNVASANATAPVVMCQYVPVNYLLPQNLNIIPSATSAKVTAQETSSQGHPAATVSSDKQVLTQQLGKKSEAMQEATEQTIGQIDIKSEPQDEASDKGPELISEQICVGSEPAAKTKGPAEGREEGPTVKRKATEESQGPVKKVKQNSETANKDMASPDQPAAEDLPSPETSAVSVSASSNAYQNNSQSTSTRFKGVTKEDICRTEAGTKSQSTKNNTKCDVPIFQGSAAPETPALPVKDSLKSNQNKPPRREPTLQRFRKLTEEEIKNFEEDIEESKSTKKNTKWGVTLFQDWHAETYGSKADFPNMSVTVIAERLRTFYCEAKPKYVEHRASFMPEHHAAEYHKNTIKNIRAALNRHFHYLNLDFDIVRDKEFVSANRALDGALKDQKKRGVYRPTSHKTVISPSDLKKISTYLGNGYQTSPIILRQAMWFTISLHFATCGKDFHHRLLRNSFEIRTDENGDEYAAFTQETVQKIFKGGFGCDEPPTDCRMYAVPESEFCPLKLLRFYLDRLYIKSTFFFNLCDKLALKMPNNCSMWFTARPLTKHAFNYFLRDIGNAAGCTRKYSPLCLRATAIQNFNEEGHEALRMMFKSGHRGWSTGQKKNLSVTPSPSNTAEGNVSESDPDQSLTC